MTNRPSDAAAWVARLGSDQRGRRDEAEAAAWLDAAPGRRAAFRDHARLWDDVATLDDDEESRALLFGNEPPARRFGRRRVIAAAAGVGGVALLAPLLLRDGVEVAAPPHGQRTVRLADGSVATLDAGAAIRVDLSKRERVIRLTQGRAYFEVARDAARPFRVLTDDGEVRALGTGFSVARGDGGTDVVLEHGAVALYRSTGGAPDAILRPGEGAALTPAAPVAVTRADLPRTQAWRFGRLVFDATPLAAAVDEVNRYTGPRVVIADAALIDVPLSGVFRVGRPAAFAESVAAVLPVRIARQDDRAIVLTRR